MTCKVKHSIILSFCDSLHCSVACRAFRGTPGSCPAPSLAADLSGQMERDSAAEIPSRLSLLLPGAAQPGKVILGSRAAQPPPLQSSPANSWPCKEHREKTRSSQPGQHQHTALGKALWEQGWPWRRAWEHWSLQGGSQEKGKVISAGGCWGQAALLLAQRGGRHVGGAHTTAGC